MIIFLFHNKKFRYQFSYLDFHKVEGLKHIEVAQWPAPAQDDNGLFVNLDVFNLDQKIHSIN